MKRLVSIAAVAATMAVSAFAIESINLTSDAYSKGANYYETGYGTLDTGRGNVETLFKNTGPDNKSADRFMSVQNYAVPNYIAFHFKDAYEPGRLLIVNKVYMNVANNNSDWQVDNRRPCNFELQGANDPDSPFVAGADPSDLRSSSEGWTTIKSWTDTTWPATSFAGKNVLAFEDTIDNNVSYRYYRLLVTKNGAGRNDWLQFSRLQLWGFAADANPANMSAESTATDSSADITLSCGQFASFDPEIDATSITLDYSTTDTFEPGSFTRIDVAQDVSGTDWSQVVHIDNLHEGTTYYGRYTIENAEGGSGEVLFTFATLKSWYVSGSGDDLTGDGSAAAPFRTITKAVYDITNQLVTVLRPKINIDEGIYSVSAGETMPIVLPSGTSLCGWSASGEPIDREARIVDGENVIGRTIFSIENFANDGMISDLHIKDARRAIPVYVNTADCVFSNCLFTQSEEVQGQATHPGAFKINGLSNVTIDSCDFIGMTNRSSIIEISGSSTVSGAADDRMTTIRNCSFVGNMVDNYIVGGVNPGSSQVSLSVYDSVFKSNVIKYTSGLVNTQTAGSCIAVCGYRVDNNWYGSLDVDRCQFLANTGNMVVGAQFLTQGLGNTDGSFKVANSLFADNVPYNANASGAKYGVVNGYRGTPYIRNCTFIRNFGSLANTANTYVYNTIFADETMPLVPGATHSLVFVGTNIVSGCNLGNEATIQGTANNITEAPVFVNAAVNAADPAFDARLRPFSPGIDSGVAGYVSGTLDLAGNARIADNTLCGAALPDLGAYESLYNAETEASFQMPDFEKAAAIRGEETIITVTIVNAASFPVTATLAGPDGWGIPSSLVFDTDTASFVITPPNNAELGTYAISISADGIVGATLDVEVVDERVTITGDDLLVIRTADIDGSVALPVKIAAAGVTASAPITLAILSVDGPSSVGWDSDEGQSIAKGGVQSDANIVITPVKGVTTVAFQSSVDFVESGSDTFVLAIVVDPDFLAIDPEEGSDETGIGTIERPFQSMTYAMNHAIAGDTLLLAPGEYTPETETFPLDAAGITIKGMTSEPEDVIITGTNGVANIFKRSESHAAPFVCGATLAETTGAIADLMDASIAFSNCVFRQSASNVNEPAVGYLYRASRLEMTDCVVSNFNRYSAISFDTTDSDVSSNAVRTRDRWFEATRCTFDNARCERALIASCRNNGTPNDVRLSECSFSNLRMYTHQAGIAGNGGNIYYSGLFHVPSGLAQYGEVSCWFTADRCVFKACKGNTLISMSHANAPRFTNCLFVDMTNAVSTIWGHYATGNAYVQNCTFVRTSGGFAGSPSSIPMSTTVQNTIIDNGELKTANNGVAYFYDSIINDSVYGAYAFVTNFVDEATFTVQTNAVLASSVIFADPRFVNAAVPALDPAFSAQLRTSSPAVNAGNTAAAAGDVDLLGNARIYRNKVDMGCYETIVPPGGTIFLLR